MSEKTASGLFYIMFSVVIVLVVAICVAIKAQSSAFHGEAIVKGVGEKGITIEYHGNEYGEPLTKKINVDDTSKYKVGDTITIGTRFLSVKIEERKGKEE